MHLITHAEQIDHLLICSFHDENRHSYPFIFLRDNDPAKIHANGQKLTDPATLDLNVVPRKIAVSSDGVAVTIAWPDSVSTYSSQWLWDHRFPNDATKESKIRFEKVLWGREMNNQFLRFDYDDLDSDDSFHAFLSSIVYYGFVMLKNVPVKPRHLLEVINSFGYPRETNYGMVFDVRTVHAPTNLAYTNQRISPHTDNPYRHPVPTLQVLHCLSSSTTGGDSVLVDGFKVAQDFRARSPEFFSLLSSTSVRFRFKDSRSWLEYMAPIIQLDVKGELQSIRYNSRSIQPFEQNIDDLISFYEAYISWAKLVENENYAISFHMRPGDLYIVDNERILHSRTAFESPDGERWLQGAYADSDGLLSTWRMLGERLQQNFSIR